MRTVYEPPRITITKIQSSGILCASASSNALLITLGDYTGVQETYDPSPFSD